MLIIFLPCFSADNSYECIGLGSNCTVASALEAFELRNAAYPFDWIVSRYESLCAVLEQDFYDFLNPDFLSVDADNYGIINKYGLGLMHDFPTVEFVGDFEQVEGPLGHGKLRQDWIKFVPEVEKKYARRIQRFRDVCSNNKKIFFIRYGGINSREEACILRNILKTAYPHLDFTLVTVGNDESFAEPWQEENIKNYHLKITTAWNDVAEWKKIFLDLGLVTPLNRANLQEKMNYYYQKYVTDSE